MQKCVGRSNLSKQNCNLEKRIQHLCDPPSDLHLDSSGFLRPYRGLLSGNLELGPYISE